MIKLHESQAKTDNNQSAIEIFNSTKAYNDLSEPDTRLSILKGIIHAAALNLKGVYLLLTFREFCYTNVR